MAPLPLLPRLALRFNVVNLPGDRIRIQSASESITIRELDEGLYRSLLPLLTGEHDVPALIASLPTQEEAAVRTALEQLQRNGLLEDAAAISPDWLDGESARYCQQLVFFSTPVMIKGDPGSGPRVPDRYAFQERLHRAEVFLLGLGRVGSNLARSLALLGVGRLVGSDDDVVGADDVYGGGWFEQSDVGRLRGEALAERLRDTNPSVAFSRIVRANWKDGLASAELVVATDDDFSPVFYREVNRACLEANCRFTSLRLGAAEVAIGPSVVPYETPCFTCFTSRLRSNSPSLVDFSALEERLSEKPWRAGRLNLVIGADLAAYEIMKLITLFQLPATYAHIFALDLNTFRGRLDPVLKLPYCPDCGHRGKGRPRVVAWAERDHAP